MKCRLNCTVEVKHSLFKDVFSSFARREKHQGHDSGSGGSLDWYQEKTPRSNCCFSLEHRKQVQPLHLVLIWLRLFLIMYLEFLFWAQVNKLWHISPPFAAPNTTLRNCSPKTHCTLNTTGWVIRRLSETCRVLLGEKKKNSQTVWFDYEEESWVWVRHTKLTTCINTTLGSLCLCVAVRLCVWLTGSRFRSTPH